MIDFKALAATFPPDRISWRLGSTTGDKTRGMALAYIDARDVIDRLDAVCGPGGWQCRYVAVGAKTCCDIGIKVGDEWIWKADGAGDTDVEAEKGAFSDAFKRAAVKWGIGRYLYDVESPWVAIEPAGKSFKIKEGEYAKLRTLLTGKAPTSNAPPADAKAQWIAKAKAEIGILATDKACNTWAATNGKALERLKASDEAAYHDLMGVLTAQHARFLQA